MTDRLPDWRRIGIVHRNNRKERCFYERVFSFADKSLFFFSSFFFLHGAVCRCVGAAMFDLVGLSLAVLQRIIYCILLWSFSPDVSIKILTDIKATEAEPKADKCPTSNF